MKLNKENIKYDLKDFATTIIIFGSLALFVVGMFHYPDIMAPILAILLAIGFLLFSFFYIKERYIIFERKK